ncbi:MAG: hypothetical protein KAH38_08140 [Candidatus Hydrogenedentes bacterium]|nr:hypothetical protein [Candidatus Hydrogenedentota bacterium]
MYTELQLDRIADYKFQASLHGAEIKDNNKPSDNTSSEAATLPQFGDPKDYEHLSSEAKEGLTAKMKQQHSNWVKGQ